MKKTYNHKSPVTNMSNNNNKNKNNYQRLPDLCQLLWVLLRESENVFSYLAVDHQPQKEEESRNTTINEPPTPAPAPRQTIPSEVIVRLIEKSGIFENNDEKFHHQVRKGITAERRRPTRLTSADDVESVIERILLIASPKPEESFILINFFVDHLASTLVIAVSTSPDSLWRLAVYDCWCRAPLQKEKSAMVGVMGKSIINNNDNANRSMMAATLEKSTINKVLISMSMSMAENDNNSTNNGKDLFRSTMTGDETVPNHQNQIDDVNNKPEDSKTRKDQNRFFLPVSDLRKELVEKCRVVASLEEIRVLDAILNCYPSKLVETDFEELLDHLFMDCPLFVGVLFRTYSDNNSDHNDGKTNHTTKRTHHHHHHQKSCEEILKRFTEFRLEYLAGEISHVFDGINRFDRRESFPRNAIKKNFDGSDDEDHQNNDDEVINVGQLGRKKSVSTQERNAGVTIDNNNNNTNDDDEIFNEDISFMAAKSIFANRQRRQSLSKLSSSQQRRESRASAVASSSRRGSMVIFKDEENVSSNNNADCDDHAKMSTRRQSASRLSRRMSSFGANSFSGGSVVNTNFEKKNDLKSLAWAVRLITNTIADFYSGSTESSNNNNNNNSTLAETLQRMNQIRLFTEESRDDAWIWLNKQHKSILDDAEVGMKTVVMTDQDKSNELSKIVSTTISSSSQQQQPSTLEQALGLVVLLVTSSDLNHQYLLTSRGKIFSALSQACLLQSERICLLKGFSWPPRLKHESAVDMMTFITMQNSNFVSATGAQQQQQRRNSSVTDRRKSSASAVLFVNNDNENKNNSNSGFLSGQHVSPSRRMIGKITAREIVVMDDDLKKNSSKSLSKHNNNNRKNFLLDRIEKANRDRCRIGFHNRVETHRKIEEEKQQQLLLLQQQGNSIVSPFGDQPLMSMSGSINNNNNTSMFNSIDKKARVFCLVTLCSGRNIRAACHDAVSLTDLIKNQINNTNNATTTTTQNKKQSNTNISSRKSSGIDFTSSTRVKKTKKNKKKTASPDDENAATLVMIKTADGEEIQQVEDNYDDEDYDDTSSSDEEDAFKVNFSVSTMIANSSGFPLVTTPRLEIESQTNIQSDFAARDDIFDFDPFMSRTIVEMKNSTNNNKSKSLSGGRKRSIFQSAITNEENSSSSLYDNNNNNAESPFVILQMKEHNSRTVIARKPWYLPEFSSAETANDGHFICKLDVPLNEANIDLDDPNLDEELALREDNGVFLAIDVSWLYEAIPFFPSRADRCFIRISVEAIILTKDTPENALKMYEKRKKALAKSEDVGVASFSATNNFDGGYSSSSLSNSVSMMARNEDESIITEEDLDGENTNNNTNNNTILPLVNTLFSGFGDVSLSISSRPEEFPVAQLPTSSVNSRQSLVWNSSSSSSETNSFVCPLRYENIIVSAIDAEQLQDQQQSQSSCILGQFKLNTIDLAKKSSENNSLFCFAATNVNQQSNVSSSIVDEACEDLFHGFYDKDDDDENGIITVGTDRMNESQKKRRQSMMSSCMNKKSSSSKVQALLILSAIPLTPGEQQQNGGVLSSSFQASLSSSPRVTALSLRSPKGTKNNDDEEPGEELDRKEELEVKQDDIREENLKADDVVSAVPDSQVVEH